MKTSLTQYDDFITTKTKCRFNFMDPKPEMIRIEDIARGLAYSGHFGGQTPFYFSIAQHCLLTVYLLPKPLAINPKLALTALLHDASEAYTGDVKKPMKIKLPNFQKIENRIMEVIFDHFNLNLEDISLIKPYDLKAQQIEFDAFYNEGNIQTPLSPDQAYFVFFNRLCDLLSKI